ncbi:MAG: DUF2490 domain-containing protein [Planctomycetota bacterium]
MLRIPRREAVRTLTLLAALVAGSSAPHGQDTDQGLWSAFAGQGRLNIAPQGRMRWWFDAHARFFEDSNGFETSIVRPGIGYDINEHTTAWLGYAWIENDPIAGSFTEQRIWQQLTWGKRYDWGTPFARTRLEQRYDERGSDTGWRLRQFVRWTKPVSDDSRLGWRVWDEGFFDLNDTSWGQDTGFRQNRAFAGMGWKVDDSLTLEVGYLNQYIPRDAADSSSNHVLAVTLLGNF